MNDACKSPIQLKVFYKDRLLKEITLDFNNEMTMPDNPAASHQINLRILRCISAA